MILYYLFDTHVVDSHSWRLIESRQSMSVVIISWLQWELQKVDTVFYKQGITHLKRTYANPTANPTTPPSPSKTPLTAFIIPNFSNNRLTSSSSAFVESSLVLS